MCIETGLRKVDWIQASQSDEALTVTLSVRAVTGIVITQDCDALRCENITLCEIRPFDEVERKIQSTTRLKGYISIITQHARVNQKWYYLPPDHNIFSDRMAADFLSVFEVPRIMLEEYCEPLRLGRLNDEVAWPHFRERVSQFYRRYPYNEWYPLSAEEMEYYHPTAERYPWQKSA
jgi:hypothetical protein